MLSLRARIAALPLWRRGNHTGAPFTTRTFALFSQAINSLRTLPFRRILALVWKSSARWTVASAVLLVVEAALGVVALYLVKLIIDAVTNAVAQPAGTASFQQIATIIALAGIVAVAHSAVRSLSALVTEIQGQVASDYVNSLVLGRAVEMDLEFYETPAYYDALTRAQQGGAGRPARVVANLMHAAQNALTLVAIGGLLLSIHWMVVVILLVATLPSLLVRFRFVKVLYEWTRRRVRLEREAAYLQWLISGDQPAKEIRLFSLGHPLLDRFNWLRTVLRQERIKISTRRTVQETVVAVAGNAAFYIAAGYVAYKVFQGEQTIGDLVLFQQTFQRGQAVLQSLLSNITGLYEDGLYVSNVFELFDLKNRIAEAEHPLPLPTPLREGIVFDNVSFRYPGAPRDALTGVNLTIRPGEVVALVGENGSGKTTLVKLLTRLYEPYAGRITLDGQDICAYSSTDYRRMFGVIFQDYAHYYLTARENIWFGDVTLSPDDPRIDEAARKAGADAFVQQLPKGYGTVLGKLFDGGEELSIGQWQKIALARAFVRESQMVVFDEPSSALDAQAEYEMFAHFHELIDGRAAVIISHRLSTIKLADTIYVMDHGRIVERGTHAELMAHSGIYRRMFDMQASYYQEGAILSDSLPQSTSPLPYSGVDEQDVF